MNIVCVFLRVKLLRLAVDQGLSVDLAEEAVPERVEARGRGGAGGRPEETLQRLKKRGPSPNQIKNSCKRIFLMNERTKEVKVIKYLAWFSPGIGLGDLFVLKESPDERESLL